MQEEVFGPLLAVCKVKSFEEGMEVVNNTEYGLKGAVFTNSRQSLDINHLVDLTCLVQILRLEGQII